MFKSKAAIATLNLGLTAILGMSTLAADATAEKTNANAILKQMSSRLGGARQFSFVAHREMDASLTAGNVPQDARISVEVQRPNKIAARSTGKGDVRNFYADGNNLSLVDVSKNLYATVPMRTSIDGLVAEIDRKYGFTPPLAELALSDIYSDIRWKAQSISYLGQGSHSEGFLGLTSVPCHRLALSGKKADAELWIGVADSLPRKLIVTVKGQPGNPHIKVEFSQWNLAAQETAQDFVFIPPTGALKIPMPTTAEIITAQKKH